VRRYIALGAATLALAALTAPAAQANHVAPTVTASMQLAGKVRDCDSRQVCGGSRRALVSWSASCGPGLGQDAVEELGVGLSSIGPTGRRFAYDGESFDSVDAQLTGSHAFVAGPGMRMAGEVTITCVAETVNSEGYLEEHRATARADAGQAYLPPRLGGYMTTRASFCGVNVPRSKTTKWLQAGQYGDLVWLLRYQGNSLIRRGVPGLRQIKLFARGAGIRLKRKPARPIFREFGEFGAFVRPRRGGTLRIWATIGGKRTNTMRVKVLPKRC
jgi:hypothetical protein